MPLACSYAFSFSVPFAFLKPSQLLKQLLLLLTTQPAAGLHDAFDMPKFDGPDAKVLGNAEYSWPIFCLVACVACNRFWLGILPGTPRIGSSPSARSYPLAFCTYFTSGKPDYSAIRWIARGYAALPGGRAAARAGSRLSCVQPLLAALAFTSDQ